MAWRSFVRKEIALDRQSIDTAVTTRTLCSIPGAVQALEEVRRLFETGGQLCSSSTSVNGGERAQLAGPPDADLEADW